MTNQGISVGIAARSELIIVSSFTSTYKIINHDQLTADFPNGIHLVKCGNKVHMLENIAVTDKFTTKLEEGALYVSRKSDLEKRLVGAKNVAIPPGTQIILPPTTMLQKLKDDGTVKTFNPKTPDLTVVYLGSIDAPPRMPFVDLCKQMINCSGSIISVDTKGFINVIADGKVVQTLFLRECIGTDVKICPNGRYIYIRQAGMLHDLKTRLTTRLPDAYHICFSADSKTIAYCGGDTYADIHVMDIVLGRVTKITNPLKHPTQIEFYSDESYVVLTDTDQIMIVERQTGLVWKCMKICNLYRFLVSSSGLICVESDMQVKVWNPLKKYFNLKDLKAFVHGWSISGRLLALSSRSDWDPSGYFRLFDVQTRKELLFTQTAKWQCGGHCPNVNGSLIFCPAQNFLMMTRGTQSEMYSLVDGSMISTLNHSNPVVAIHWCC